MHDGGEMTTTDGTGSICTVCCMYIRMYVHLVKDEVEVQSLIPENDRVHRPGQWRGQRSVIDN